MNHSISFQNQVKPRCSVIIPVKNESQNIRKTIMQLNSVLDFNYECLIVVDDLYDPTISEVVKLEFEMSQIKLLYNNHRQGFVGAIKSGISESQAPVVVIMMADGSDDPVTIPRLISHIESGVTIASASRYSDGGYQQGGGLIKKYLSKLAGTTFKYFTGCGTSDVTNNFKAYDKNFLINNKIESIKGFELGLEMVSKAVVQNLTIKEVGTFWSDRTAGTSKFLLVEEIPRYLKWYLYGIFKHRIKNSQKN